MYVKCNFVSSKYITINFAFDDAKMDFETAASRCCELGMTLLNYPISALNDVLTAIAGNQT
jgi:hypothetical protein